MSQVDYTQKKFRPRGFMNAVLSGKIKPESQAVNQREVSPMDSAEIKAALDAGLEVQGQYCVTKTKV